MYRLISDMCMRAGGRMAFGQAGRQAGKRAAERRGKGESRKHNRMRVRRSTRRARGISQRENDGDDCDEFVEL